MRRALLRWWRDLWDGLRTPESWHLTDLEPARELPRTGGRDVISAGIQLVHDLRALLPAWWCDDCGRFRRVSSVIRTPFNGRLVTEVLCYACTERAIADYLDYVNGRRFS